MAAVQWRHTRLRCSPSASRPRQQATPAVSAGRYLGRLPEGFEASMSTVSAPESRSATLPAPRDPPVVVAPDRELPTPWFTRHMLGAIEAERDRRHTLRGTHRWRATGRTAMPHPRLAAALAAQARRTAQARVDLSRWADEGGRFDPEAAALLRIGDRAMKRCNS
jgi:hypothetical protein